MLVAVRGPEIMGFRNADPNLPRLPAARHRQQHLQRQAARADRCVRVAQVMDAQPFKPGFCRPRRIFGPSKIARPVWVEPKEWHLLEILTPHLKRAAEAHQLLSGARAATESLGAAVGAAGFAVRGCARSAL